MFLKSRIPLKFILSYWSGICCKCWKVRVEHRWRYRDSVRSGTDAAVSKLGESIIQWTVFTVANCYFVKWRHFIILSILAPLPTYLMYMNIVSLILIMRLYMYNLRPLIYDNMITFITISVKCALCDNISFKWPWQDKVIYYNNITVLYHINIVFI